MKTKKNTRILLLGLYSEDFPMACETHALSVLAGNIVSKLNIPHKLEIIDLYALDYNQSDLMLLNKIKKFQPDFIGISVPYGSFSFLEGIFPKIKLLLQNKKHQIIFGGAIPTYIPDVFLNKLDVDSIVVIGEGDETLVNLINCIYEQKSIAGISNICYISKEGIRFTPRSLVDISKSPPPYRLHFNRLLKNKIQIFTETSRGCSWARCSFCPRGLLDINGSAKEFRYYSFESLEKDLICLYDLGVRHVCFSDEDFLGRDINKSEELVSLLLDIKNKGYSFLFDVSMNVHSIYSSNWSIQYKNKRKLLISKLPSIGVKKVFLGIESGVKSQLKRYYKNHTPEDGIKAIKILEKMELKIEIGFIPFDPLCTYDEVQENLSYLQNNGIVKYVSSIGSGLELRIQPRSLYYGRLKNYEKQYNIKLLNETLDYNTLSIKSDYLNEDVNLLVRYIIEINKKIRIVYYSLKSLTRHGNSDIKDEILISLKKILESFRERYITWLLRVSLSIKNNNELSIDFINSIYVEIHEICLSTKKIIVNNKLHKHNVLIIRMMEEINNVLKSY